jgi:predicted DNA-binding transcriptional regulator YafY
MRADRLLSILMLLQTRKRMTAHDLAQQLEVSERTIYRDLEALSSAGFPVYTERGPHGGCSLLDGYQTTLNGLTEAELRALFLCTSAHSLTDLGLSQTLESARLKLATALPAVHEHLDLLHQRVHIDTTGWNGRTSNTAQLTLIQDAIWRERQLLLNTCDHNGYGECYIEPYGLVSKAGDWYVVGKTENEMRVVPVSHISTLTVSEKTFARPPGFDLARSWVEYCEHYEHYERHAQNGQNSESDASNAQILATGHTVSASDADTQHNANRQRVRIVRRSAVPAGHAIRSTHSGRHPSQKTPAHRGSAYKKTEGPAPMVGLMPLSPSPQQKKRLRPIGQTRAACRQQKKRILIIRDATPTPPFAPLSLSPFRLLCAA